MAFDTREYEWADVTLILGGRDVTGVRGVKYSEKVEREALYAKGRYPHSIQSGNASYDGELTMLQSEYEALVIAGKGSIMRLKGLTAVVSYGDAANGDAIITDSIEGIYFTEANKEIKQNDKNMEIVIPFVATRVRNQIS